MLNKCCNCNPMFRKCRRQVIELLLPVQRIHYGDIHMWLFQRVVRQPPQSTKPDFRNALYAGLEPITV